MPLLRLDLLGGVSVRIDGQPPPEKPGRRPAALLAYLAVTGKPQAREALAALLWPDRFDEQARQSLRQAVASLRRLLGPEAAAMMVAEGDRLALDPACLDTDVAALERCAASPDPAVWEQAGVLHAGPFLDGLGAISEPFDQWAAAERSRLDALAADTLGRLLSGPAALADSARLLAVAERLAALDPYREDAQRALMRAYRDSGRPAAALRQFTLLKDRLAADLGAEPEEATRTLYQDIRAGGGPAEAPAVTGPVPSPTIPPPPVAETTPVRGPRDRRRSGLAAGLGLALVAGLAGWLVLAGRERPEHREAGPQRPSILIGGFSAIGDHPETAGFAGGLTQGVATALTRVTDLAVIAPSGAAVPTGTEADFLFEGSVQRDGARVRVTVRLVDLTSGTQVWTDSLDREAGAVFAVQDAIVRDVLVALRVRMAEGEQGHPSAAAPPSLAAWVATGAGLRHLRAFTRADTAKARALYREAVGIDPSYRGAWEGLAWTHLVDARFGWNGPAAGSLALAEEAAATAEAKAPGLGPNYSLRSVLALMRGDHAAAIALGEQAVAAEPGGADAVALLGFVHGYAGDPARSAALTERAKRLSPAYPRWYDWSIARAHRLAGRHAEALALLDRSTAPGADPGIDSVAPMVERILVLSAMGDDTDARAAAARLLAEAPDFSSAAWLALPPDRDPARRAADQAALRRAGLPD